MVGVSIIVFLIMRIMPGEAVPSSSTRKAADQGAIRFGPEGMTKLTEAQRQSYMEDCSASPIR